jgi:hypothetical protein
MIYSTRECVSCGKTIGNDTNHHCSANHERGRKAADTRYEMPVEPVRLYHQRLSEGWDMLQDDEQ